MCYVEFCENEGLKETGLDECYCYLCADEGVLIVDLSTVAQSDLPSAHHGAPRQQHDTAHELKLTCPKCSALVLQSLHASHVELCRAECSARQASAALASNAMSRVLLRTQKASRAAASPSASSEVPIPASPAAAAGIAVAAVDEAPPLAMGGASSSLVGEPSTEAISDAAVQVGARFVLKGRPGLVWSRKLPKGSSTELVGFAFDDAFAEQPWISVDIIAFRADACSWHGCDNSATACRAVLTEVMSQGTLQMKLPAAYLYGLSPPCCAVDNWEGFCAYKPLVSSSSTGVTAPPPVSMEFARFDLVMCTPPFVSANKGSNTAPTPLVAVAGRVVGIMLGSELNSTKGSVEYRRWVAVQLGSTSPREAQLCLLPLTQVASWPAELSQTAFDSEHPRLSASECDAALHEAALAKKPGSYNSHLCTARNKRKLQLENQESGPPLLDRTRGAAPRTASSQAMSPASARTTSSESGIKHGLDGIAEGRIDTYSEEQLLMSLREHGLPAPPASEPDKSLYAKRLLFKRCGLSLVPNDAHTTLSRCLLCLSAQGQGA